MVKKPTLPFLETMATQACNLSCQGCTNYSDLPFKGYVKWTTAKTWIESWLERINILDFGIIGGEPLLNPEIKQWLYGCRDLLPNSQLRFTTNGLLLKSAADLLNTLDDIGNIVFKVTLHTENSALTDVIDEIFASRNWSPVTEYGIDRWALPNGVRFQLNRPEQFLLTYRGSYHDMMPHYSNPEKAFGMCVQQTCPLLWNGRIYKCSTAGLLTDVLSSANPTTKEHWKPFVDPGISADAEYNDIVRFIENFGKFNKICAQCPDSKTFLINHKSTVSLRKTKIQTTT
jgi:sulfatase maturation enzyme AslB (radical SAM superfamily)